MTDPFDPRLALRADGLLRTFNDAGVLTAADVHVARRLGALVGEADETVLLAVGLAVRAPRLGHVHSDLRTVASTAVVDRDDGAGVAALPWPDADAWLQVVAASPLVAVGEDDPDRAPIRLIGCRIALDRYWHEERRVAEDLRALDAPVDAVDETALAAGLARLFPPAGSPPESSSDPTAAPASGASTDASPDPRSVVPDLQALAAETAVRRHLTVLAGGPGTGKTRTVSRIVALIAEQAAARGERPPLVALAAPTGKAAARMEESLREAVAMMDVADDVRETVSDLTASTLHRLLGWRPDARSRFRHHRANRLPHDVVIVDETSMVSLSLMARLVEAVRPDARLILVGDPGQLVSVEAGAVLGDIVGPAAGGVIDAVGVVGTGGATSAGSTSGAADETAASVPTTTPHPTDTPRQAIVVLRHVHRFGGRIAELTRAVADGDAETTIEVLRSGAKDVTWLPVDVASDTAGLEVVREHVVRAGRAVHEAAGAANALGALRALESFRVLCAHRRGPYGAFEWMRTVERWLTDAVPGFDASGEWYVGRPLLVSSNDYGLKLFNGDTGVVIATEDGRVTAVFERADEILEFAATRLGTVDTVHAMTIHKAQGSQFGTVAVVLPPAASPLLTRELLYTGLSRAQEHVIVVGAEDAIRTAVERPAARASGLRERLWGAGERS